MPDSDPTNDNPRNTRNLPAVVQEGEVLRPAADNWLLRAIRTLFGWKAGSVRDDLQVVLDASQPDEVGFSAIERTMLRNILSLHERRIADVMVHRADIVEQIVGEIDDEHDSDEPPSIVRQPDNSFIADARASLDDARSVIGEDFVTGEAGEEVETLGGYLVSHVGRLPVRGEVISGPGNFEVEVLDADPRRVKRLRIATRKERPAPRMQRESRRREPSPDAGPTPPSD